MGAGLAEHKALTHKAAVRFQFQTDCFFEP